MEHLSVTALQCAQLYLEDNDSPLQFELIAISSIMCTALVKGILLHLSYSNLSKLFIKVIHTDSFTDSFSDNSYRLPCIVARSSFLL